MSSFCVFFDPQPKVLCSFLVKKGGIILQKLKCLHASMSGCCCSKYKILKNSVNKKIFLLLKSFHECELNIAKKVFSCVFFATLNIIFLLMLYPKKKNLFVILLR